MSDPERPAPLAQIAPTGGHLTNLPLGQMQKLGHALYQTGFLPATIKNGDQAMAVILKGQELRIPPMYALSNVHVISGKPTCSAELMLALIFRDHGDQAIRFVRTDAEACTISYKRRTETQRREYSFTADDAERAKVYDSPQGATWRKYTPAMLRARCVSAVARLAFPDTIAGMYTPEELGAAVTVDEATEEVTIVEAPAPAPQERRSSGAAPRPVRQAPPAPEPADDQGEDDAYFEALDAEAAPAAPQAPRNGSGPAPLPPTQTQLETIAKLARSVGETVATEGLNRAQASELITRLSEKRYGQRPAQGGGAERPASADQLRFLGELSQKVGEPVPEGLTMVRARELIEDWKGQVASIRAAEVAARQQAQGAGK